MTVIIDLFLEGMCKSKPTKEKEKVKDEEEELAGNKIIEDDWFQNEQEEIQFLNSVVIIYMIIMVWREVAWGC